jgi:putative Mg2+ transporter-C (MgtC) family protein
MSPHWEVAVRLVAAAMLGGVIGYERDVHGRPAGLRTHIIVALASATFMIVSTQFVYYQRYVEGDLVSVDPSRIASTVVSGIGFLGAGAILRTGFNVKGLTTAAGLWLVAAIGLAAGAGMYVESLLATALGLLALWALRRIEGKEAQAPRRKVSLVLADGTAGPEGIRTALAGAGIRSSTTAYERHLEDRRVELTLETSVDATEEDRLLRVLEAQPGVRRVRVEALE